MKTALYARVSTNNGQDPEMQLRELQRVLPTTGLGGNPGIRRRWDLRQQRKNGLNWISFLQMPNRGISTQSWFGDLTASPALFLTCYGRWKPSDPLALSL